ncbi:hypothetical protein A2U01_0009876, partial [Trifolium medium]|nr:hypothetical protein [Trifolium medium]
MHNPNSLVSQIFKARWIIGDGSKVNVMKDPWIRNGSSKWVCAPQVPGYKCMMKESTATIQTGAEAN